MSDAELPDQPQGHLDEESYHTPPVPTGAAATYPNSLGETVRGGRGRRGPKDGQRGPHPRKPQDHWNELQELRSKLAEHEETMGKLRSAFGMISAALDIHRSETVVPVDGYAFHDETPAHRPARLSRRGGANSVNTSHYKNNNRGGGYNNGGANSTPLGGYRQHRGNAPGFHGP